MFERKALQQRIWGLRMLVYMLMSAIWYMVLKKMLAFTKIPHVLFEVCVRPKLFLPCTSLSGNMKSLHMVVNCNEA